MFRLHAWSIVIAAALLLANAGSVAAQEASSTAEPCAEAMATPEAMPGATPAPVATPETAPAASPGMTECTVDIRDLAFTPAAIEIAVGTTVTWTNNDTVPHTATESDGTFDSGTFDPGESFSYTFDEAGTFDYTCLIHPQMEGTIVVR